MKIIGITGKAGAGKNEVGRFIQDELDWCMNYAFADAVKSGYANIFDDDYRDSQSWKSELVPGHSFTRRHALQGIGDGLRQSIHPDIWVNVVMAQIDKEHMFNSDPACIITDVRYPNEVESIQARGGVIVRVVRPNNPTPSMDHPSETALDWYVFETIVNDGSIDDLKIKVQNFLKSLNL